jgi:hypothetical protein
MQLRIFKLFTEKRMKEYEALLEGNISDIGKIAKIKENINFIHAFITVYCYLGYDVANYGTAAVSYTETFLRYESRTKTDLAACAFMFFQDEKILESMMSANPYIEMEGVTLRPRVTQVPIIGFDKEKKSRLFPADYISVG